MKVYSTIEQQKKQVLNYNINEIELYLNKLSAAQNLTISNFKSNCILFDTNCYIINNNVTSLTFLVTPGTFFIDSIFGEISEPVILDTGTFLDENVKYIFICAKHIENQYKLRITLFYIKNDVLINPDGYEWDDKYLILSGFKLDFNSRYGLRIFSYIFSNYINLVNDEVIKYGLESISNTSTLNNIYYSQLLENSSIILFDNIYLVRPLLTPSDKILTNLNTYLTNSRPVVRRTITDLDIYEYRKERVSRHLAVFREFYDDFYS
jgi:hypothetical protein